MARSTFGGRSTDYTFTTQLVNGYNLLSLVGATLTMWDAPTGGNQHTDLLLNGSPVTSITVPQSGQVPEFQGPNGVTELWADAGAGRVRLTGTPPATVTGFYEGTGSPEGVVSAVPGSVFVNTEDGGWNGARRWAKDTGTGNTGWVPLNYDTGWRIITSWDSSGNVSGDPLPANLSPTSGVAGSIQIRRVGTRVSWHFRGCTWSGGANLSIPVGFRPGGLYVRALLVSDTGTQIVSPGANTIFNVGSAGLVANGTYATTLDYDIAEQQPPNTLPGTAA